MSEDTVHLVERLRRRLRRTVRRLTLGELAFGLVLTLGICAALWLASAIAEAGLWMRPGPRTVLVSALGVVASVLLGAFVARPLLRLVGVLRQPSDEEAARRVGSHFPEIADRFVNLLQLSEGARSGSAPASSAPLADRAVAHLGRTVEGVKFENVEDFSRARRASRFAIVPVAGLLIFLLAAPGAFLDASSRLLAPTAHFQRPAPFRLALTPGDAELVKGDSLAVTVRARPTAQGRTLPTRLTLQVQAGLGKETEEHVEKLTLAPVRGDSAARTQRFRHVFTGVRTGFRYRAVAEANGRPLRTDWGTARVSERPRVQRLQVTLQPPSYSGLPERTLAPGAGDVTALPGTQVTVNARLEGPTTQHALLRFSPSGDVDTLSLADGTARGTFPLSGDDDSYRLALRSESGAQNADPIRYRLRTTSDAAPTVSLTAPAPEASLTDALRPQLRWQMSDDFGFASQRLYYRLAERRHGEAMDDFASVKVPVDRPGLRDQQVTYDWVLRQTTGLDLVPGDVLEYYVRVWDNNRVAGYRSARTQTQRLRLPSLAEKYERLDQTQQGAEEQMQQLEEQSEQARRQFENLRDEVRRKREGDWEDQRQVEQLRQRQQQLQQGAEKLSRQIEKAARQMQEGQLTSPETRRAYEELQQVAREIQSPELEQALKDLQKAMQEMDMEKMQQALKDFEFSEKQYRERLKRTKELFEKLKAQQQMEEVARRAGELAEEERRLAEETRKLEEEGKEERKKGGMEDQESGENAESENSSGEKAQRQRSQNQQDERQQSDGITSEKREQLAREQERAREKMQKLRKQMQQLSKDMKGMRGAPQQQMQKMQQQTQQMPQQMKQNSQQLRQNQLRKARQGQRQMQKKLQQMQQAMQQMQKSMNKKGKQLNVAGLRQALANTLRLSKEQEALRRRTGGLSTGSPALRTVTRRQNELAEGLRTTSDSLTALSREIPKMTRAVQRETGESLRAMQQAVEAMTGRTAQRAGGHQKVAMKNLNELALLLSQLLQQMQQSQNGQGGGMSAQQMMQQLQQMAGQQQKLNGQVQQMLNDMQGDRLTRGQSQRLKQMAQQQKALQKQLQQLRKQGADGQAIGDLERVAEQMGETIGEMQRQRLNRETLKRQQQILSRLLQAQQSLQKRGKKEQRRGRTADGDYTQERPADAAPEAEAQRLRRALIRSLESGYTPDYERLIKRYFELLQEQRQERAPGGAGQ